MYISFLCNDRDLKGVLVNNHQLKKFNTKYKYTCLVTTDVDDNTINILQLNNIDVIIYDFRKTLEIVNLSTELIDKIIKKHLWGKLLMFDFSKNIESNFVYLDADILIEKNIDELMDYNYEFNEIRMSNDSGMVDLKTTDQQFKFVMKETEWNAGIICFSNENDIFNKFASFLKDPNIELYINDFVLGDQTFLNTLIKNNTIKINTLSIEYNTWPLFVEHLKNNNYIKDISIIHFVEKYKPWENGINIRRFTYHTEREYYIKWNKIYLEYLEKYIKLLPNMILI